MLATLVWLAAQLPAVVDGEVLTEQVSWIPTLDVFVDLRLDGFGALMLLLVVRHRRARRRLRRRATSTTPTPTPPA